MGKSLNPPRPVDPSLPTMTIEDAVVWSAAMGVPVTKSTIRRAIYQGNLRRHLIQNRVRLSENDIRSWMASTADAHFVPRHVPGRAS